MHKPHELVFTGTNSAIPNKWRNCSGSLIRLKKRHYILFECAEGTQMRIMQGKLPGRFSFEELVKSELTILISHNHIDHIAGLIPFIRTLAMKRRTKDLVVIGPGTKKEIEFGLINKGYKLGFDIIYHDISKLSIDRHDFHIECVKVPHGDTLSLVYILESQREVNMLFGDCTYSEVHDKLAKKYKEKVNLVIHECTLENDTNLPQRKAHSTPKMVVKFWEKLRPKNMFVTHFSSRYAPLGSKKKNNMDTIKDQLSSVPIKIAEELIIYKI